MAFEIEDGVLNDFDSGNEEESVVIPDGIRVIGSGAFRNCLSLTRVRNPAGCAIGENAFEGCGTVYLIGVPGSPAETYCQTYDNCVFVPVE